MTELLLILAGAAAANMPLPAFLAGCWEERRAADAWTEECWTSARGGLMLGSGRDGKGGGVGHWEWMRIERTADGSVTFYGSPKGAVPVAFKATRSDARSITFVNAAHDYPQRIHYRLTANGLDAETSLVDGNKRNRWSFRRSGSPATDQPTISSGLKK
jgi:hypothetical protein